MVVYTFYLMNILSRVFWGANDLEIRSIHAIWRADATMIVYYVKLWPRTSIPQVTGPTKQSSLNRLHLWSNVWTSQRIRNWYRSGFIECCRGNRVQWGCSLPWGADRKAWQKWCVETWKFTSPTLWWRDLVSALRLVLKVGTYLRTERSLPASSDHTQLARSGKPSSTRVISWFEIMNKIITTDPIHKTQTNITGAHVGPNAGPIKTFHHSEIFFVLKNRLFDIEIT